MPSEPKLHPSTDPYDHASCSLTRENLDAYLAQSGYGANVAMFSCYFVRHAVTGAPLCITCGRPIGEHCSARMAVVPEAIAVVPPEGLKIGDTQDVFEVKRSWGPLVAVVMLSIFLAVELGIFFGLGLQRTVPFAFIVPAIVFLSILVVMGMPTVLRIVFTKGNGPQSEVVVTRRRLFGCETGTQTTVEGLGQVGFRETQYRRGIDFTVMAVSAAGEETALHTSMSYTAAIAQYSAWRAYFAQYGIAAHPTFVPTVTSFA